MATKTVKRQKRKKTTPTKAQTATAPTVTLVGTYKEKQLAWIKRHGVYNYPVAEDVDGSNIRELWLYADAKARRHCFAATFVGVQTRAEFIAANPTYAKLSPGKGHAEKYLVFKTEYLDYGPRLDDSIVHVRTSDFTKSRAKKVAAAIRRYEADGEFGSLANYLPSDLAELPRTRLRVREAAVQFACSSWSPVREMTPQYEKIESLVLSINTFSRKNDIPSGEAFKYLETRGGLSYLDEGYECSRCLSLEAIVEDVERICRRNGGTL